MKILFQVEVGEWAPRGGRRFREDQRNHQIACRGENRRQIGIVGFRAEGAAS
jgi:hypothetical protein